MLLSPLPGGQDTHHFIDELHQVPDQNPQTYLLSEYGGMAFGGIELEEEAVLNVGILATADPLEGMDREGLDTVQYWVNGVATNILVVVGLIANGLTLAVLCRRLMASSTNAYLSALAVWDSVVLVCSALLIGLPAVVETYRLQVLAYVVSYAYPIALIAQTATIWLTVSFTVERYIAVSHPLQAASMCTVSRARLVTLCVSLASATYNLPRWFEYRPTISPCGASQNSTSEAEGGGSGGCVAPQPTAFAENSYYRLVYYSWLYLPTMCIVPLAILFALNLYLIMAVRRSRRSQKEMNVKQSRENNVTVMLSAVVVVFIVCQVPALVYNLAYAADGGKLTSSNPHYRILSEVRNFLVNVNSATNFLLYCAFGQKFRRVFLKTFCRRCTGDGGGTERGGGAGTRGRGRGGRQGEGDGDSMGAMTAVTCADDVTMGGQRKLSGVTNDGRFGGRSRPTAEMVLLLYRGNNK